MAVEPLTHHEILGLVEPFTRCGRHLDLTASDRLRRVLEFRPVEIGPVDLGGLAAALPGLRETLRLEQTGERFRLIRLLTLPSGLEARLDIEGSHPAELLQRMASVEPARQWRAAGGCVIGMSYRLDSPPHPVEPDPLILTRAVTVVAGLTVVLNAPLGSGAPAEIDVRRAPEDPVELPEDLLAVLGWGWGLLTRRPSGWRCSLRLRGREPGRSRRAEAACVRLAVQLERTLAEPPARFHERWLAARWGVAFRRSIPVVVAAALVAGVALLPRLHIAQDSAVRMLLFNLPPVLLVLVFCLPEIPPFEIPRWPARSMRVYWRQPSTPLDSQAPFPAPHAG